jgi:hypothetical protein
VRRWTELEASKVHCLDLIDPNNTAAGRILSALRPARGTSAVVPGDTPKGKCTGPGNYKEDLRSDNINRYTYLVVWRLAQPALSSWEVGRWVAGLGSIM